MSKTPKTTTFAVGSKYGPRSFRWIVTVKDEDVFVTTGRHKDEWKATLHQSGRWHVKWLGSTNQPPFLKTHRRQVPEAYYPVGLFIVIPDDCLRPHFDPDRSVEPDVWFDRPPYGGITEIAIVDWTFGKDGANWPGQQAGTVLNCVFRMNLTKYLMIVTRQFSPDHPLVQSYRASLQDFQLPKPIALNSPLRRAISFGTNAVNSLQLVEFAID